MDDAGVRLPVYTHKVESHRVRPFDPGGFSLPFWLDKNRSAFIAIGLFSQCRLRSFRIKIIVVIVAIIISILVAVV